MIPRDEVLRVARKCGAFLNVNLHGRHDNVVLTSGEAEAFARHWIIYGLEAAKRECDARYMGDNNREDMEARRCAEAIQQLIDKERSGNIPEKVIIVKLQPDFVDLSVRENREELLNKEKEA